MKINTKKVYSSPSNQYSITKGILSLENMGGLHNTNVEIVWQSWWKTTQ